MLKSIRLQNFRQHLDRTFEFGPGLNAVRGENEAGKTTVLEAFTYFCFGAAALRESIDDVVTYTLPVSKLRVDCTIEHLGVTYTGYRGKSGAEVSFGREKITGQREVTKYFERLFGATADMAGRLMFASQKSLAESLKAGPTAAGKMIEDLANFDLIDRVAEAIAERRQTGDTRGVEGRIAALAAQITDAPAEDLTPLRAQVEDAAEMVTGVGMELDGLRARRAELDVEAAIAAERGYNDAARAIETLTFDIDKIDRALAQPAVLPPAAEELARARAAVEAEKHAARAAKLHAELQKAGLEEMWDQDFVSLQREVSATSEKVDVAAARVDAAKGRIHALMLEQQQRQRAADVEVAQLEGRLIRETTCALCQKDLTDVPEVVRTNSALQRQIDDRRRALEAAVEEITQDMRKQATVRDSALQDLGEQRAYLAQLCDVVRAYDRAELLFARAAEYIEVDRGVVPGRWRWIGPMAVVGESAANRLALLERLNHEATRDAVQREEQSKQRANLITQRDAAILRRATLPMSEAHDTLETAAALDQEIRDVAAQLYSHQGVLQRLQGELATKEALAAQAARQVETTKQQLAQAQAELAAMQRYNLLIKKVRAARPVITNKLWNIVLGGVSKHLSEIRDQPSIVTRADGVFKVNGYPAAGLSGSAEDMLGLAMRITLTKTFLPGIDMLQLDEPGAACSDARETRMLGVLSTLNFGQIVMISHNPLVDAVADRIITV